MAQKKKKKILNETWVEAQREKERRAKVEKDET